MCGICGIWGSDEQGRLPAMVQAMRHRGPDDRGVFSDGRVSLGMTRLAVIDLSPSGHQPMSTEDGGITIVYNGETYNFAEERAELERSGFRFRSSSDTEVVLRLYERFGDDFVGRLRGMFALAIYDRRSGSGRERLLLARDHFGIKPLLYAEAGSNLVFASEVRSLLASGLVAPEVDPEGLRLLLTYGSVTQPRSMIRGVRMLPPAHRMVVDQAGARVERYWRVSASLYESLKHAPYEAQVEVLAEVLRSSVKRQLVSDVPVGAFLSGGIDSSLLVGLMARESHRAVKTFSVGFEREGALLDESTLAGQIARYIGTDHTAVLVRGEEVAGEIERIAWNLDQPSVDGVNTYFVSKAARREVTVAISGNGGDELFAGYPWFTFMAWDQARRRARPWEAAARALIAAIARGRWLDPLLTSTLGPSVDRARGLAGFKARLGNTYQVFGSAGAARLLAPDIRRAARAGRAVADDLGQNDELPRGSVVQRVSAFTLRGYNGNQLLRDIDVMSMAHSLEVRVPYLDPDVSDVALSLPDAAKLGATATRLQTGESYRRSGAKRILFDVGRGIVPPDLDLQEKRGFGMPFEAWMRGPLRPVLLDALSDATTKKRGFLETGVVRKVREDALEGRGLWMRPWLLLMLELWCRTTLDGSGSGRSVRPPSAVTD